MGDSGEGGGSGSPCIQATAQPQQRHSGHQAQDSRRARPRVLRTHKLGHLQLCDLRRCEAGRCQHVAQARERAQEGGEGLVGPWVAVQPCEQLHRLLRQRARPQGHSAAGGHAGNDVAGRKRARRQGTPLAARARLAYSEQHLRCGVRAGGCVCVPTSSAMWAVGSGGMRA